MDEMIYMGYGYTFDNVDTSKFSDKEKTIYKSILNSDKLDNIIMEDAYSSGTDDPVVTDGYVDDTLITYIPDQTVVSNTPIKTYTFKEADNLIVKHTKLLFRAVLNDMMDQLPKELQKYTKEDLLTTSDRIVDKMNIPAINDHTEFVNYD